MQQSILKSLLAAFFAVILFAASALAHNPIPPPCDPAPIPTNLTVTGITPTSISCAWNLPGPATAIFQVDVVDVTAGITYPSAIVLTTSYTATGLVSGHMHQVSVRASYGAGCPFSQPAVVNQATPTIIVDEITGIQQTCTPSQGINRSSGSTQPFCVAQSSIPAPFNNAYFGQIAAKKPGAEAFNFRVAYYLNPINSVQEIHISQLQPVQGYSIPPGTYTNFVNCTYNGSILFRIGVGFSANPFEPISGVITFQMDCRYGDCGSQCAAQRPGMTGPADRSESGGIEYLHQTLEDLITPPSPNPFSESTTLQYQLNTPQLVSIHLYDAIGHLVQTVQPATQLPEGEYTTTLEGATLPKGTYFAVVQTGDKRHVFTLLKQE